MKIDLCKLFGVEEGEEFKIKLFGVIEKYRLKNGELERYDNDYIYKWVKSRISINDIHESEIIKLPKKKQFSQDTLNLFKCIDKKYKWIAKDKSGDIFGFEGKPKKDKYVWLCEEYDYCLDNTCCIDGLNQSLFNEILWEDEEPIRIDDYVER